MAIDEQTRHRMYQHLEEVLGIETATALMEHLPPVGWADVATKRDLDALAVGTKRDLDGLRREIDLRFDAVERKLEASLHREVRSAVLANFVGNGVLVAAVLAASQLI